MASETTAQNPIEDSAEKNLSQLLAILRDGLSFVPPLYVNSILGHPLSWLPPYPQHSEFRILDTRQIARTLRYLVDVTVPAVPLKMPDYLPGIGTSVFWRPTRILFQPDADDDPYSFPDEAWIFINGVATNPSMARINAEYLARLFHRPMTLIQNATDGIALDFFEAILGKSWSVVTEASAKAYPFVHHALHNPNKKRVVVICHSQGTIIMSNVLRALIDPEFRRRMGSGPTPSGIRSELELRPVEDLSILSKLEIYAFANCADVMTYAPGITSEQGRPVPWIESYGNQYDFVARCGVLAPRPEKHGIRIDGSVYRKKRAWGHLLNHHYLRRMARHLESPGRQANEYLPVEGTTQSRPRLFDYFQGQRPEAY